jgi:hypothetical protein
MIGQWIDCYLTENYLYTLQVDIGRRLDTVFPGYNVD